ncbi:hypothetical protein KQH40_00900 [bacterium]|nr:hypothetical protein [bacterium]
MNAINLVFAITGGAGVYLIFAGVTEHLSPPRAISASRAEKERKGPSFQQRIESMLYQARAPISYAEFMGTSFAIGLIVSFAFFFLTKGFLVSLFGLVVGMALYYVYLSGKKDKVAIEYEKVQPEIADIMAASFRSKGYNLPAVLNQVIVSGPEIARDDWIRLAAAMESRNVDERAINKVLTYRNSPGLWRIVEAILLFRHELERLAPLMDKIKRDLTREVAIEREIITEMVGPRKQLLYVAMMPAVLLVIFVLFSPEIGAFYSSGLGQIVMIAVLSISGAIYYFGTTAATKRMRIRQSVAQVPGSGMIGQEAQRLGNKVAGNHSGDGFFDDRLPVADQGESSGMIEDDFSISEGDF